jgi:molecular chaperone HtpG
MFSSRKEDGLKLYARKVLIQEYNKDLLPEYLGFMQGVVDSEDLPLNVSRESVQSTKVMSHLKKLVTTKVIDSLIRLAQEDEQKYHKFWDNYARYIKQGIAMEPDEPETLYPLLRFHTTNHPDKWISLDEYTQDMKPDQKDIYYIMGDDEHSVMYSPHLDVLQHHDYEVILMVDPVDAFMLVRLDKYKDYQLTNVAVADLAIPKRDEGELDDEKPSLAEEDYEKLIDRFKNQLGESVSEVRMTDRLADSPARLVDPEGALNQEMQRVYRLMDRDFEVPKKVLELNPRHPIMVRLNALSKEDPLNPLVIQQIYEDALLIEGLHPDPASMISRIQKLIEKALV